MKRLILIFFALGASLFAEKPNILYILADDLGYGDVQCLNPQRGKIATPHLDKLAAQGMTFTDAHSGSSVCTPTRYGLLTGRYAWRTRLQAGVLDGGNDEPLIAADRLTVAGLLKAQGYTTACIGKWHLGFQSKSATTKNDKKKGMGRAGLPVGAEIIGGPVTRGFDLFWGCSNARTMSALIEGDRVIETIEPITMLPRLGKRAVSYVQEHAADAKEGKPFFLYLPLTSPHTPILPTPEWQGKSGLGDYGDFVMMTDAIVGDVLNALDQAGLANNTFVFFTADNGCSPQAGTGKLEQQGHFASERLRGYKADIWDGGHRVPFFVRWPGKVKAGSQNAKLICHTDLMATCAEILGLKLPENAAEDSVSLLPALLGTESTSLRQSVVHHSINGRFAVREGRWKLCLCPGSGGWGKPGDADANRQGLPPVQLYDLNTDIAETKNLSAEHPDIVAKLTQQLEASIANGRSTPGAKQANDAAIVIFKSNKGAAAKK
ncbi:arylsulfatase [Prosthecobacter sp.]|uniref:sulfatase family protein n=1 Tax=Prosthecobacter sp. TaxID=1965333 RepID=UPI002ABAA796|nr:arylsulfatase [Prosthecobacter sp.]MDZ4402488.1 arylsulfatase [Prosthecobacter sp.]